MLPSPFSCLAADHCSITICYCIELCKPSLQKWVEDAGPLYLSKKSRPAAVLSHVFHCLLHLPAPAVPGTMHRSTAKQTNTNESAKRLIMFFFLSLP